MLHKRVILSMVVFLGFFCGRPICAQSQTLTLAVDSRYWYPFTYIRQDGVASGMHIEMVIQAMKDVGFGFAIEPYPRKRCLFGVERGAVDGMISVAYSDNLSGIFIFPEDAGQHGESMWRIMQVDHVVITCDPSFEYNGDLSRLPVPVRLPAGSALADTLKNAGLRVDQAKTDLQNMRKLMRDRKGCVITSTVLAERMAGEDEFRGKIKIEATPVSSQSFYLAFSKKSSISPEDKERIWNRIRELREDYVYMLQLFALY